MYEQFGAVVTGQAVEFKLFFPDNQVDATQYGRGAGPNIARLRVAGDFQSEIGGVDWDFANGLVLQRNPHPNGWLYSARIDPLPDGFYQYKYLVEFQNGTSRWCSDPCTKYGGSENQNAAFVVGGNSTVVQPIASRRPLPDLTIYELMIDDFTAEYRSGRAPIEAVADKLPYLRRLGINTIEFMPWTAWRDDDFGWGYNPTRFFSVEHRYTLDQRNPLDKLYKLQVLINQLHANGIHVIMDGVFDHVDIGLKPVPTPDRGFPYYWLYEDPRNSPYTDPSAPDDYGAKLDWNNACTTQFIFDVCKYWLDQFQIDGIRFDYVLGFYSPSRNFGITELVADLKADFQRTGRQNTALILEMLTDNRFEAIHDTDQMGATGCWFDPLMYQAFDTAASGRAPTHMVRVLDTGKDFDPDKAPVTYLENHDHSSLVHQAGGRNRWFKAQPLAIALLTAAGAPLLRNGQEFGQDVYLPDSGDGRVVPRPLVWSEASDTIGVTLNDVVYRRLIDIRRRHPALRSANFYPDPYDEQDIHFNAQGYGVDQDKSVAIYHRWGPNEAGQLERFIIAVNFSDADQTVDIPFSENGNWQELLSETTVPVQNYRLANQSIPSNWGRLYLKTG